MVLTKIASFYHLLLVLGAFYLGISMFLGRGVFADFPPEWIGTMPFRNWESLALFGMIVFGGGNAIAGVYGFIKKDKKVFLLSLVLGALLFLCASMPVILLGEWYLPTAFLTLLSAVQLSIGFIGLIVRKS